MLGWSCIPESIINSSYDLKSFAVSVSLQQQDVTQRDNSEEQRITPKKGKPTYCGSYFFGKHKYRPFTEVGHVIKRDCSHRQLFRPFGALQYGVTTKETSDGVILWVLRVLG